MGAERASASAVEALAPGLHELVAPGARVERLATGFGFVEGPVWHPEGYLLFSDLVHDARRRWLQDGTVEEVRRPNAKGNGMTLDAELNLLVCEHVTSMLVRERPGDARETLASHWDGRELNSPNDVVVRSDGSVYFSDPWYGRLAGHGLERPQELGFQGVYRVSPAGELELLADDFALPNGLCFSPDESLLYVDDTARAEIRAFRVQPDGTLGDGWVLRDGIGTGDPAVGVVDGIKCDERGNVWVTGPGGVWVLDPSGTHLGTIGIPEVAANLTWGGEGLRTLFVAATTSLYAVATRVGPARLPHHR